VPPLNTHHSRLQEEISCCSCPFMLSCRTSAYRWTKALGGVAPLDVHGLVDCVIHEGRSGVEMRCEHVQHAGPIVVVEGGMVTCP
jgi:hypothetical protein